MGGRIFVNFSSDDYLNLATEPQLARAAARAAVRYGCGAGASHLFTGNLPPHRALERALTHREGCDAAMVLESSFTGNLVLLGTLAGPKDAIFCDVMNSGALIDGCYLTGSSVHLYRHADVDRLENLLRTKGPGAARRLIVTETVFGMDGDLAPLGEIIGLADKYDAFVLADESQAAGVFGDRGRGLTDDLPEHTSGRHRLFKTCSLSKAFGSQGGFVCGSSHILSDASRQSRLIAACAALAVPAAAAARRGLMIADQEPDRRLRVLKLAHRLRSLLEAGGVRTGPSRSQIVPVIVRSAQTAVTISRRLEVMGLLVPAIRSPLVPRGQARLRISLTAGHTDVDVDRLVSSLGEVRAALAV
jgi:8-amino-7-oxononanoate synthase